MLHQYLERLKETANDRRSALLPNIHWIVIGIACCTLAYIGLALLAVPSDEPRAFHFMHEEGAVTALSVFYLAVASAFSLAAAVTSIRTKETHSWVWLLMASGFAFLSFDELLQFHERVGYVIGKFLGTGVFRNWNDIIVIIYGLIAASILVMILPELLRWKWVLELFAIAFAFYGLHTVIDTISEPPTQASIILEESAKLFCGAFWRLAHLLGFSARNGNSLSQRIDIVQPVEHVSNDWQNQVSAE